jgi:hypothetical protein
MGGATHHCSLRMMSFAQYQGTLNPPAFAVSASLSHSLTPLPQIFGAQFSGYHCLCLILLHAVLDPNKYFPLNSQLHCVA